VNTAARLQGAAPVNRWSSSTRTTYRATRAAIDYDEAAPVEAKCSRSRSRCWLATAAHSALRRSRRARRPHGARRARARVSAVVRDAFERARHERTPQLLTLAGVPGIGRAGRFTSSRASWMPTRSSSTWRKGRCLAYGDGITLWRWARSSRHRRAFWSRTRRRTYATEGPPGVVEDTLAGSGDETRVETHLLALLGLRRRRTAGRRSPNESFAAWRRFLDGLAEQLPLVVVVRGHPLADESLSTSSTSSSTGCQTSHCSSSRRHGPSSSSADRTGGGGKLKRQRRLRSPPLSDEQTAE